MYDCSSCELRPFLKTALGHDGPPQQYWKHNLVTGQRLNRCPVRDRLDAPPVLVREVERHVHDYFPHYQRGHLLTEGGISDQPNRYLEFMREISNLDAAVQRRAERIANGDDDGSGALAGEDADE